MTVDIFLAPIEKKHIMRHLLEYVHEQHPGEWRHSAHINNLVSQAMCRKVFPSLAIDGVKETILKDIVEWTFRNAE